MRALLQIKLSDFGLARKIREGCSVYNISNVGVLLPIAWLVAVFVCHESVAKY